MPGTTSTRIVYLLCHLTIDSGDPRKEFHDIECHNQHHSQPHREQWHHTSAPSSQRTSDEPQLPFCIPSNSTIWFSESYHPFFHKRCARFESISATTLISIARTAPCFAHRNFNISHSEEGPDRGLPNISFLGGSALITLRSSLLDFARCRFL